MTFKDTTFRSRVGRRVFDFTQAFGAPLEDTTNNTGEMVGFPTGYSNVSPDDLTFKDEPDRGDLTDIDIASILDNIAK